jgi:uncharacterized protein YutE (UPF0331/DUF86 family)
VGISADEPGHPRRRDRATPPGGPRDALDLATHIAASRGRDVPDYTSAIDALAELGVLDADFARRFRGVAGFRNVLVHGYLAVDKPRLHRLLNENLDDFAQFAARVSAYLSSQAG